jgi:hypothetical protein
MLQNCELRISSLTVTACLLLSCSCYGHASRTLASLPQLRYASLSGRCDSRYAYYPPIACSIINMIAASRPLPHRPCTPIFLRHTWNTLHRKSGGRGPRNFRSTSTVSAANGRLQSGHGFYRDLLCFELRYTTFCNPLQKSAMTPMRHGACACGRTISMQVLLLAADWPRPVTAAQWMRS